MAIKTANKRYMMLVNTFGNLQNSTDNVWTNTGGGSVGYLENSLFYMGFSKNYNKVVRATKYDMASSLGGTSPTTSGGTGCCIEFENYDKGSDGPMISQKVPAGSSFRREWLNVLPGQSKQVGVWPVNIALHTYVDNDYVASQALAQAWLLKDANNVNGVADGPSNGGSSYKPCVYRHHYDLHIKNYPACISGLNPAQNKILYNSIAALRKHAYAQAYPPSSGLSHRNIDTIYPHNCMNYYDPSDPNENLAGNPRRDDFWTQPVNYAYQSKSFGGGYVSLHHLHFTTYGNTTSTFFDKMSFYIPRSTGETATKIRLKDGLYDRTTNTTHYWIYFYNNRVTNRNYYSDEYSESGWAYDSPINIPVGKIYSKITPVMTNKNNAVPSYTGQTDSLDDLLTSTGNTVNDSAWTPPTRYVASFNTSFNIYIVCEDDVVSGAQKRNKKDIILGASGTDIFRPVTEDPELDKDGNPIIFNKVSQGEEFNIEIEDDSPEAYLESDELDTALSNHEEDGVAGVQICSITGFLVDYTWAYSKVCTNFINKEYARSLHGKNVKHHQCVSFWDNWISTPKMYGLLLLQHCCSNGQTRYFCTDGTGATVYPEYNATLYAPGVEENGIKIVSSMEEPKFKLNNRSPLHILQGSYYVNETDGRWLEELYNIIKISNNNAKIKLPTNENTIKLTSNGCHNKCLYTSGSKLSPIISSSSSGTSTQEGTSNYTSTNSYILNEWYMNHYDESTGNITDCGVLFTQNGSKYDIKYHETVPSDSEHRSIIYKVEDIINDAQGNHLADSNSINNKNVDYITGKLGKALAFYKKYRAKFSINKDSIRINGISLNKMASKFPLEARSYDIPNIITFKLRIDFKYYLSRSYGDIGLFDTANQSTDYATVGNNYILPSYKLYNDDLAIDSVGTLKDIILPSRYSENFPYYNVSLRLPLTAIDDNFCHTIGHNKFLGATCYDISNSNATFKYIDSNGEEQTVSRSEIISANSPLKGIKYIFNIINAEVGDDKKHEVLTCILKFYNDSDTFGFLDFNFKFPKFEFNDDSNASINETPFIIEGTTVLSKLMNKIIIKGIINNDNSFVFSDTEFTTTIKKSLNSNVNYTIEGNGSTQPDTPIPDGVTIREDTVTYQTADDTGMGEIDSVISQATGDQLISSEENGVMNIADENSEVLITPENVAVLDRSTGEVIGVGNKVAINYNEYGRFISSYLNPSNTLETKKAGQDMGLGMKNVENMCITRNILPVLSNKIMVY